MRETRYEKRDARDEMGDGEKASDDLVGGGRSYRSLTVWRRAMELNVAVYSFAQSLPRDELYGLSSQLRRASVSVISNIAEGHGRGTRSQLIYFLTVARGSAFEVEAQLLLAQELKMGDVALSNRGLAFCDEVSRMLFAAIRSLKAKEITPAIAES